LFKVVCKPCYFYIGFTRLSAKHVVFTLVLLKRSGYYRVTVTRTKHPVAALFAAKAREGCPPSTLRRK